MNAEYSIIKDHGFLLTWTHTKMTFMLTEDVYMALQHCENLEDVIVKLTNTPYNRFLTTEIINTPKAFKNALYAFLKAELDTLSNNCPFEIKILLDYFLNTYRINNFIFLLISKEDDFSLNVAFEKIEKIGFYNELLPLKLATDMHDVFKFCVENTFLEKFYKKIKFDNEIRQNDFQVVQSLLLKYLLEEIYEYVQKYSYMRKIVDILKTEGDRRIIEIVLNTMDSVEIIGKKRASLFPNVCTLNLSCLEKLSECTTMDDLRGILVTHHKLCEIIKADDEDMLFMLTKVEVEIYKNSFGAFNDISCIYSYLRLKEQEIKNIMWIIECILMKKQDAMKNIIIPRKDTD